MWLHGCTGEFNTVLNQCRVLRTAHGVFDSVLDLASELLSMAEVEQALAAEDVTLEHSLAMCPVLLQNRQRFCSKQHCHSACVSLPSFPSFKENWGWASSG